MRDVATMSGKAQAWLGNLLCWGQRRQAGDAETLYAEAVRLARNPVPFSITYGVSDDVDGRFDALSLVVILVMRRLKSLDDEGKALSQQLFDSMFADMDLSLREMGAGDIGVSKRVRVPWPRPLWGASSPMFTQLIIMIKNDLFISIES